MNFFSARIIQLNLLDHASLLAHRQFNRNLRRHCGPQRRSTLHTQTTPRIVTITIQSLDNLTHKPSTISCVRKRFKTVRSDLSNILINNLHTHSLARPGPITPIHCVECKPTRVKSLEPHYQCAALTFRLGSTATAAITT